MATAKVTARAAMAAARNAQPNGQYAVVDNFGNQIPAVPDEPPHFLRQVTVGNLLSAGVALLGISAFAWTVKGDVRAVDMAGQAREARINRLELSTDQRFSEVGQQVRDARKEAREDSTEVKAMLRDLGAKIDQKADKQR